MSRNYINDAVLAGVTLEYIEGLLELKSETLTTLDITSGIRLIRGDKIHNLYGFKIEEASLLVDAQYNIDDESIPAPKREYIYNMGVPINVIHDTFPDARISAQGNNAVIELPKDVLVEEDKHARFLILENDVLDIEDPFLREEQRERSLINPVIIPHSPNFDPKVIEEAERSDIEKDSLD